MADHWKSIANLLGAPGMDVPEAAKPTEEPEPVTPEPEATSEDAGESTESSLSLDPPGRVDFDLVVEVSEDGDVGDASDSRDANEDGDPAATTDQDAESKASPPEVIRAVAPKPERSKKAPAASETKPKRKSSWEALANLFNVSVERPPEPEAVPEDSEENAEEVANSDLSIFGDEAEAEDANPALEAMFADAPRESADDWAPNKRMVDDIGWEDEAGEEGSRLSEEPAGSSEISRDADPEREPVRRGRRRRGRGRGGRDSQNRRESSETGELAPANRWEDDDSSAESPSTWTEPDSFDADGGDEDREVERRSNRRRRRGRTRSGDASKRDDVQARDDGDRLEGRRSAEDDFEDAPRRSSSREEREGGRPRRRRRSSESRSSEGPARETENLRDEADRDEKAEVEPKHRNIPTWVDALQPVIEANTENHRRSESRGGSRGRSRGRR